MMAVPESDRSPEKLPSARRVAPAHSSEDGPEREVPASTSTPKSFVLPSTIGIANIDHTGTRTMLSFSLNDRIVNIKLNSDGLLEGEVEGKNERGSFYSHQVEFVLPGEPATLPSFEEESIKSPVQRFSSYTCSNLKRLSPSRDKESAFVNVKNCGIFIAIFVAALAVYSFYHSPMSGRGIPAKVNVTQLMGQFKSQDPFMWDMLRAGLMQSKGEAVKTFLFLHNSQPTTECLIEKLSNKFCTVYKAEDLSFDDSFISRMKHNLREQNCMVIYDLENLQPDGVKVLKGFCDAYAPVVRDAKFFFALNAGGQALRAGLAKELLESKWSKVSNHDEFGGTVTRLTQIVLTVAKEEAVPC